MEIKRYEQLTYIDELKKKFFIEPVLELGMAIVQIDPEPGIDTQGIALEQNKEIPLTSNDLIISLETASGYQYVDIKIWDRFGELNVSQQKVALRYIAMRLDTYLGQRELRFDIPQGNNMQLAQAFPGDLQTLANMSQKERTQALIEMWPRF